MKKKITIVKVCPQDYTVTKEELEHWHNIFNNKTINDIDKYNVLMDGKIKLEGMEIELDDTQKVVTFVKVGDYSYRPTEIELQIWREVFVNMQTDPTLNKIFCHNSVEIEQIDIGDIIAVE